MLKGKGNVPVLNYAVRNENTFRTGKGGGEVVGILYLSTKYG